MANITRIVLNQWICFFLKKPPNATNMTFVSPVDENYILECDEHLIAKYIFDERAGQVIRNIFLVLTVMFGIIGVFVNIVNIIVLKKSTKGSFQCLLMVLTTFDLMVCFFAITCSIFTEVVIDNTNRSKPMIILMMVSGMLYSLGRTGSVFITILVTMERYLVIAFPFQMKTWLTARRSAFLISVWLFFIFLINLPWWLKSTVIKTDLTKFPTGPVSSFPYLIVASDFALKIYGKLHYLHAFVDYVLPLPILLVLNGLLYISITNWKAQRANLKVNNSPDINTARMFSFIAIILFSCHSVGVIGFVLKKTTATIYPELVLAVMLAVTFNSTVNFFIYYGYKREFRKNCEICIVRKLFALANVRRDSSTTQTTTVSTSNSDPQNKLEIIT